MPFVVIAIVLSPSSRNRPRWSKISRMSERTVGSPPVSRILLMPEETKREERERSSGVLRRWDAGVRGTPEGGMQ